MNTLITNGIAISVETFYQQAQSDVRSHQYVYAYRVTIENKSNTTVQLLRRHWFICDSLGEKREVEGEGVIGIQPVLKPGETYQYVSGCNLKTEMGRMHGTYLMENQHNKETFKVNIPSFDMIVPFKNN